MLPANAQHKLARDGDDGARQRQRQMICPEQQAQRKAGDERAARIKPFQFPKARAQPLSEQRAAERDCRLRGADLEVQPGQTINQQSREREDLNRGSICKRIRPDGKQRCGSKRAAAVHVAEP